MSMLDDLRDVRQGSVTAYHDFLLKLNRSVRNIHIFVEGPDDTSFYSGFILSVAPIESRIISHICGNKKFVYETFSRVEPHLGNQVCALFFVDKDLSDLIGEAYPPDYRIYVTEYYSIENYLVTDVMFRRIWAELFKMGDVAVDMGPYVEQFASQLGRFYAWIQEIMAWIVCARRHGLEVRSEDVNPAKLFFLDADLALRKSTELEQRGVAAILEVMCSVATPGDWVTDSRGTCAELAARHPKSYIRGKFELWFLVQWTSAVSVRLRKAVAERGGWFKTVANLGEANAVLILGPRVIMPPDLMVYLNANIF